MERAKETKEAHGEIETHHPGYLGSQDSYYVGNMKGVGRIYQQTFVDTYSRVAFAQLYTEKNAVVAAHTLNATVLPWYEANDVKLLRILTDRGTEYCGKVEQHAYQLFLALEDIDHTKTKARSPQTNGICERFHRTMKQEFYDIAFRKKIYHSVEELQEDANAWLQRYNELRPHSGRHCYGKTPMQTFIDSKHLAKEKQLDELAKDNLPGDNGDAGNAQEMIFENANGEELLNIIGNVKHQDFILEQAFVPIGIHTHDTNYDIAFWYLKTINHPILTLTRLNHFSLRLRPINSLSTLNNMRYHMLPKTWYEMCWANTFPAVLSTASGRALSWRTQITSKPLQITS